MIPMITRSIVEAMLIASGLHEPAQRETVFASDGFDISALPPDKSKIYGPRAPSVDLIVAHVTDVRGGFGVKRADVKRWEGLLAAKAVPAALANQLDPDERTARRFALWERYRRTGYHRIGATNGDVLRNHPIGLRTKHGNTGNRGVGWVLDVGHDEPLDEFMVETGRASLRVALLDTFDSGPGRWITVAPHRSFSAMRGDDPGVHVWQHVVLPVVVELKQLAKIDYELREGTGRPVPRGWDGAALYDARGRLVRT